jgi:hypothetical protein
MIEKEFCHKCGKKVDVRISYNELTYEQVYRCRVCNSKMSQDKAVLGDTTKQSMRYSGKIEYWLYYS